MPWAACRRTLVKSTNPHHMRSNIFQKNTAPTPLARLLNAYTEGLSTIEICSRPCESMRACRLSFVAEERGEELPISVIDLAKRYYELTTLSNSLNALHGHVQQAADLLATFFTDYDGDLLAYAIANRRHLVNKYGSDEDADWHHTGKGDPDAGEGWEVSDTTDPARLAEYGLHGELARFFSDPENYGEYIGSSGPEDYIVYTNAVAKQTDFGLRQMFAASGTGLNVFRLNEDEQLEPISLGDQIEAEINEDLANASIAEQFNTVLEVGCFADTFYKNMPPGHPDPYRVLHRLLKIMLNTGPAALLQS